MKIGLPPSPLPLTATATVRIGLPPSPSPLTETAIVKIGLPPPPRPLRERAGERGIELSQSKRTKTRHNANRARRKRKLPMPLPNRRTPRYDAFHTLNPQRKADMEIRASALRSAPTATRHAGPAASPPLPLIPILLDAVTALADDSKALFDGIYRRTSALRICGAPPCYAAILRHITRYVSFR